MSGSEEDFPGVCHVARLNKASLEGQTFPNAGNRSQDLEFDAARSLRSECLYVQGSFLLPVDQVWHRSAVGCQGVHAECKRSAQGDHGVRRSLRRLERDMGDLRVPAFHFIR